MERVISVDRRYRTFGFLAMILMALVLVGCEALKNRELTTEDGIASVYATVETVNQNTAARVAAGLVTPAEARAIVAVTSQARLLADAATAALERGSGSEATSSLSLAIALLTVLEERLAT